MIYLYFDKRWVKILAFKKSLLGQEEISFFSKKHETNLWENVNIFNIDFLASAIKEGLNLAQPNKINEKNAFLILPQDFFVFFRSTVPADLAESAIEFFIKDKARSLMVDIDSLIFNYLIKEENNQKFIFFYGIKKELLEVLNQLFSLLDLKIEGIIPETLAYFKLFEKTLRKEKKEIIFYSIYEESNAKGYLFDSLGLLDKEKWEIDIEEKSNFEKILKDKFNQLNKEGIKVNRLILSGALSEDIRQDTFTKNVGVWTNPLKKIIINFYKDYLDKLILKQETNFSILTLDVCFGAFIFIQEEKFFLSFTKQIRRKLPIKEKKLIPLPILKKEVLIFIISFIFSFIFFVIISRGNLNIQNINLIKKEKPTPTNIPTNTPTPTPSFKKEELKITVLNGSGIKGKAGEVRDILKEKGYGEIITGNADNFDYQKSEIKVKKEKLQAQEMLERDLKDYLSSFKKSILDEKELADIVIILGADFK